MDRRLVIERKVSLVRDNLEKLRRLAALDRDAFFADFAKVDSALHRLQTSIQALLDLGAMVAASKGLPAAAHATDLIDALHLAGAFPADRRDTYVRMVRFRNVLVHLYNGIDLERVFGVLHGGLGDIERLLDDLLAALQGPGAGPSPPAPAGSGPDP